MNCTGAKGLKYCNKENKNIFISSGISVLYFMLLVFILFQTHADVRRMIVWLYPELHDSGPDEKVSALGLFTW